MGNVGARIQEEHGKAIFKGEGIASSTALLNLAGMTQAPCFSFHPQGADLFDQCIELIRFNTE